MEIFPKTKQRGFPKSKNDFEHMPCFQKFLQEDQSNVNKAHLLGKNKKTGPPKTHFTAGNLVFLKMQSGN